MANPILPNSPENTRIEIILGCMYSGKSTELLRLTKRYQAIGKNILLINHTNDIRTGNSVKTHRNETENALKITNLMDMFSISNQKTAIIKADVIGIDDAQFFGDLYEFVLAIEQFGKTIIISGLDGDSDRKPFGQILQFQLTLDMYFFLDAHRNELVSLNLLLMKYNLKYHLLFGKPDQCIQQIL